MQNTSLDDLKQLAAFARRFLKEHPNGFCVGLSGDVGAGKTTFVRACVEEICLRSHQPKPRVVSPSYVIHQSYRKLRPPVEHFDFYRMDKVDFQGLVDMGYFEALEIGSAENGFIFVEWPERAGAQLLQLQATLHFEIVGQGRLVSFRPV